MNGLAINSGIHIAYSIKRNGVIELSSLEFPKRAQFHIAAVPWPKENDWADYLRGATKVLTDRYTLRYGLCGVIQGSLPIGGLSSSAAVTIAFLTALCAVNHIYPTDSELILLAQEAENKYVGVSCGILDQSCEILSKKNHLLFLDTKDNSYEQIPANPHMPDYKIAIFFSGLERSLVSSKYNMRQDECKAAAYALMAFANMPYGNFRDVSLRDVPEEIFAQFKDRLPDPWQKRATHYYEETARAQAGAAAWRNGDLNEYGRLIFESGYSSIANYECGCDELKTLYNIMRSTDGIYGGRFSGAGFKGCCMAFIDPSRAEQIAESVQTKYLAVYPDLKGKYSFHLCESADGVSAQIASHQ
ncbi:putative galactokinase [Clostridiales bacterium KLE1615]|nr:putative galactokinase [Clostridiales bacterium KLE1615]